MTDRYTKVVLTVIAGALVWMVAPHAIPNLDAWMADVPNRSVGGTPASIGDQQNTPAPGQVHPNITIVRTRPISPTVPNATQTQQPVAAGMTPEVHDAIVRGLASGNPEAAALANQVLDKYTPDYQILDTAADGSIVAVNRKNPSDVRVIYRPTSSQ